MKIKIGWTWMAGLILLTAAAGSAFAQQPNLTGDVHFMEESGRTLSQKWQAAENAFKKSHRQGSFFTGYTFLSRRAIHMGKKGQAETSYRVAVRSGKIRVRRAVAGGDRSGYSMHTEDEESAPAGILLLNTLSGKKAEITDTQIIDLEDSYAFDDIPVYWLGDVDTSDSMNFLEKAFRAGTVPLQKNLIFVISLHDSPRVDGFLREVALGSSPPEVRKNAIFWLGNSRAADTVNTLKEIYRKSDETELKKQVVFALSLHKSEEAVREMIRIARSDESTKIRKNAIFWLGQRASQESIAALKDVVDESDEHVDVKKSAVFAISQLPSDQSVPMLLDIARSHKNATLRKNAIFWLGQSGDEKALKLFEEILLKK